MSLNEIISNFITFDKIKTIPKLGLDTLLVLILLFGIVGGSGKAVKDFKTVSQANYFENTIFKSGEYNANKSQTALSKDDKFAIPESAISQKNIKNYTNIKGEGVKVGDTLLAWLNTLQAPYYFDPNLDSNKLGAAPSLAELVPVPNNPTIFNRLLYPRFNVIANLVFASNEDVDIIYQGRPCSYESMSTPFQKLAKQGVVHLAGGPKPGELSNESNVTIDGARVGSAYYAGHSGDCVAHEYARIFEPLVRSTAVGDEFFMYDERGRKLKFRVFEVEQIRQDQTDIAYKLFEGRRVVTLQTSVSYSVDRIERWLTRGELVLE